MNKIERMRAACDEKFASTGGECELYECYFLGWCDYCLEAGKMHGSGNGREGDEDMSDCRNGGRDVPARPEGYPVLKLRVEFAGDELPWMRSVALNGREVIAIYADGKRLVPARERDWDGEEER